MDRNRRCRAAIGIVVFAACSPLLIARADPAESPLDEIRRLEAALKSSPAPDSIQFCLARAWRRTDTIEGRQRALDLFRRIRRRYFDDPDYHLELARTYLAADRRDDARRECETGIRLRPDETEARREIARIRRDGFLRYANHEDLEEAIRVLEEAVEIDPRNPDSRIALALCLLLMRAFAPGAGAAASAPALREAEAALVLQPDHPTAMAMRAVALLDLGQTVEAEAAFRRSFAGADPRTVVPGLLPPAIASSTGYDGPVPVTAVGAGYDPDRRAAGAADDSDGQAGFGDPSAGYWSRLDPTPLTPVNEAQVEHWRRLVLADLIYGRRETGLRGWATPRGDLFVRYGPPHSLVFVHGGWAGGEAAGGGENEPAMNPVREMQRHYGEGRSVLPFDPPQQQWAYHIGGRDLSFSFEDQSLQDDFVPRDGIRFAEQLHETPAVLLEETQGRVPVFYFASSGRRGSTETTRQALALAIPLGTAEDDWLTAGHQSVRILDPAGEEIFAAEGAAGPEAVRRPRSDLPMLVLHGEAPLAAGHYTAEIRLESPRAYAGITVPLDVRRFGADSLSVSDLELCFPPDIPNPGGLVVPGVGLQVRFDVYNLVPLRDDVVRYRNRYVILPRTYAVAAARLIQEGRGEDPAIRFGAAGRELGGVTLHERNYADVLFPPAGARLAREGRGAFTFEIDAVRLDPGEYALVLQVEDLSTGRSAVAQAAIRVLTAGQVAEMGAGE